MSTEPAHEHQVGITNAQENNPNPDLAELTREMNALFSAKQYAEAARIALSITALSKDELRGIFEQHGVKILHLDHEAFGIYAGVIEPSYDLSVDGETPLVLAAATEFGKRHVQEAILIARKSQEGESDPAERLGLSLALHAPISAEEAVVIAAMVQASGFKGATFVPKRGEVVIYHTDDLGMTPEQFDVAATSLIEKAKTGYLRLTAMSQKYIIQMSDL